ncbi:MAG: hypothetical protein FWC79_05850 [Oscillospiraceae bacterium]|nr:hypothetical protein [Oscillospiraceae bacterium]
MAIITFWNDGTQETGQTISLISAATQLAVETKYKILVMNTKYNDISMEDCFWNTIGNKEKLNFKEEGKTDVGTGIQGLAKAVMSNRTAPEIVTNYTKVIFKNKLELLTDRFVEEEEDYLATRAMYKDMIRIANKYYDLIFIDLEGPLSDKDVLSVLGISNVIVPTVTQSLRSITNYMELRKEQTIFNEQNSMTLIGRYDKNSKYNEKNVARHVGVGTAYGVPYSTLLFESCHEGQVADYFIKFRKEKATESNGLVVHSVRNFTKTLIELLQLLQMNV